MTNKEKYNEFFSHNTGINIYSSPWWLDAVAGEENWDVILVNDKKGDIIASFPFVKSKGLTCRKKIGMPILTQKLGPYIVYGDNFSDLKRISYEQEIYNKIIEQLPKFDLFNVNFDQKYKNWLPFYWNGFKQTSRCSYKIFNLKDLDNVFKNFANYKRQKIKKAENFLTVRDDMSIEKFYAYFEDSVKERGEHVCYSFDFFKKLADTCFEHNSGKIYYCFDSDNNIHAAAFIVWDKHCAYYLSVMRKSEFNTSGGNELLVWHIIKDVSQFVDEFDFEGSMMKGVEESYRYYGGMQTEYYNIIKDNRIIVPILRDGVHLIKELKRRILRGGTRV